MDELRDLPRESITFACDGREFSIAHYPTATDTPAANVQLHALVWQLLWPPECEPQPSAALLQAEVAPGWASEVLPAVPAAAVTGCGEGLVLHGEREIWLADADGTSFTALPSAPAAMGEHERYARVEDVACAGSQVYAFLRRPDMDLGWPPHVLRLDTKDAGAAWQDVTEAFGGSAALRGLAGSRGYAIVFGTDGVRVLDGLTADRATTVSTYLADVTAQSDALTLWGTTWTWPAAEALWGFRQGGDWQFTQEATEWEPPTMVDRVEAVGGQGFVLTRFGALCALRHDGTCEPLADDGTEHLWAGVSESDGTYAVATDWRLRHAEGGLLAEHAVALYRVTPRSPAAPERILWSDAMVYPPGSFVDRQGRFFLPAGNYLMVLRPELAEADAPAP